MGTFARYVIAALAALSLVLIGCGQGPGASLPGVAAAEGAQNAVWAALPPGEQIDQDHWIGAGKSVENLTVFAVYAKEPKDVGDFTTLEKAITAGTASVREVGSGDSRDGPSSLSGGQEMSNARVNTLVIENKGELPILVLAGTVVKGGKQDRQIGEDFVVPSMKTVDVAAFCVEQGRWNGTRDGEATGGRFVAQKTLAVGKVRAAGQYEKDQSEVWSKVAETNKSNDKSAPSGTLMASMDDVELGKRRAALARVAAGLLGDAPEPTRVVGLAYAVDGQVRGIRWFAGPKLFALHRDTLLETAAFEAITSQAEARARGAEVSTIAAEADSVMSFVDSMHKEAVSDRKESEGQAAAYKKADSGYASELVYDAPAAATGKAPAGAPPPKAAPTQLTVDFFKK